jgi:ABC-type proline/glycine betaine transport system permease subunit
MVNNNVILAGAIPAAILAVLANAAFGWIERRLSASFGNL